MEYKQPIPELLEIKADTSFQLAQIVVPTKTNSKTNEIVEISKTTKIHHTEFIVFKLKNVKKVKEFNKKTYVPRGGTSLYDAIGKTIDSELDRLSSLPKGERPNKTLCVILTDGGENASREYHQDLIKRMINEMREEFNWEFIFLAANQDAMFTADGLGISKGNAMNFDATGDGVTHAYASMSKATSHYRASDETSYDIFEKSED